MVKLVAYPSSCSAYSITDFPGRHTKYAFEVSKEEKAAIIKTCEQWFKMHTYAAFFIVVLSEFQRDAMKDIMKKMGFTMRNRSEGNNGNDCYLYCRNRPE